MSVRILITGDFCPSYSYNSYPSEKIDPENVFSDFLPEIENSDISIVNLECPLTDSMTTIDKCGPNLKAGPFWADLLNDSGFNVATLANNHIMDYGKQGLEETLRECSRVRLSTVGAGVNLKNASETFYKEISGTRLAIINFAENEFASAELDKAGSHPMDIVKNSRKIRDAKNKSDYVIVIIHGGSEHCNYPSPRIVEQYRFYADMGADVIVAHHTHCVGGVEIYNNVPIIYGLGNFFFPRKVEFKDWAIGYAVRFYLNKNRKMIDFDIIPYCQSKEDEIIKLLHGQERQDIINKALSIGSNIQSGNYIQEWNNFAESRKLSYLYSQTSIPRFIGSIFSRLNLLKLLIYANQRMRMKQNHCSCESHRDVLLYSYKRLFDKNGQL
ncbi:MAG: CapA family protein [Sedimentisphaeraceae bacterium JB056]